MNNSNNADFYSKYLKYKNKYLDLKLKLQQGGNQIGGNPISTEIHYQKDRLIYKYTDKTINITKCDSKDPLIKNDELNPSEFGGINYYLVINKKSYLISKVKQKDDHIIINFRRIENFSLQIKKDHLYCINPQTNPNHRFYILYAINKNELPDTIQFTKFATDAYEVRELFAIIEKSYI